MRCIVTGGAGFVGSHLTDRLIELGHDVFVIDNFVTGLDKNLNPKAHLCKRSCVDLGDYFNCGSDMAEYTPWGRSGVYNKVDVIFHLAALARIQPSFESPWETYKANSNNTVVALEMARHYEARLVYAGTSSIYHDIYANPYTYTKWLGEQHCTMYNRLYDVPVAIARFFNVYGPRQIADGPYATLIGIFEKQRRDRVPLTITGTGNQRRDFTHVSDIVDGLVAMSEDDWNAEIFNLGRGKNFSINEVAMMFGPGEVKYLPKRPGEAQETLADISFTKSKLNWQPKVDLEQYIKDLTATLDR